jgi:hypothetical protein
VRYYDSLGDAGYPVAGGLTYEQDWQEHLDRGSLGGVDFAVPTGSPVIAPTRGIVENLTNSSAGNYVNFHHLDDSGNRTGFYDQFMHLSRFVSPGVYELGATIGFSGNTGSSTGPHIHQDLVDPQGKRVRFWLYFTPQTRNDGQMYLVQKSSTAHVFTIAPGYLHHVSSGAELNVITKVLGGAPVVGYSDADLKNIFASFGVPWDKWELVSGGKTWSRELEIEQMIQTGGGSTLTVAAIAKGVNDDAAKRMAS